jgi:hypothetical protein
MSFSAASHVRPKAFYVVREPMRKSTIPRSFDAFNGTNQFRMVVDQLQSGRLTCILFLDIY